MKSHSGVFVREAWPSSSLQKYPPIVLGAALEGEGRVPQSCFLQPALSAGCGAEQLGNQARRGQGHFSGFMDLFAGDAADTLPQGPQEAGHRQRDQRNREGL